MALLSGEAFPLGIDEEMRRCGADLGRPADEIAGIDPAQPGDQAPAVVAGAIVQGPLGALGDAADDGAAGPVANAGIAAGDAGSGLGQGGAGGKQGGEGGDQQGTHFGALRTVLLRNARARRRLQGRRVSRHGCGSIGNLEIE